MPCLPSTIRAPDAPPTDVDAFAAGASPFGVLDMAGNKTLLEHGHLQIKVRLRDSSEVPSQPP